MPAASAMAAAYLRRQEILRCVDQAGPDGLARRHLIAMVKGGRDATNMAMSVLSDAGLIESVGAGTASRWFTPRHAEAAVIAAEIRASQARERRRIQFSAKRCAKDAITHAPTKRARLPKPTVPAPPRPIYEVVPCSIWRYAEMIGAT